MKKLEQISNIINWYWFIFWYEFGISYVWAKLLGRLICPWFGHKWQALSKVKKDRDSLDMDSWFEPSDISNCKRCWILNDSIR